LRTDAGDVTGRALVAAGLLANGLGTLWRWPSVGRFNRNGYELASSLATLGKRLDFAGVRVVAGCWYLVPMASALALLALGVHRRALWVICLVVAAAAAVVSGLSIWSARKVGLSGESGGPVLCVVASASMVAGAAMCVRRRRHPAQRMIVDS
jgi:hypothetical protein